MIKALFLTVAVIFSCLGICDFIHILHSALLSPRVKSKRYNIVFLKPGSAAEQLRYNRYKLCWYGADYCDELIGIVDDLDDTEASSCEYYCYKGNIHLCRFENLIDQINFLETGEVDEGHYGTKE